MNETGIGPLIRSARQKLNMTQKELAEKICVTEQAISKWERGAGYPDRTLLPHLAECFGMDIGVLISGDVKQNEIIAGNMKKLKFFVCPSCGNVITATGDAQIFCCGAAMKELKAEKAGLDEMLEVELVENDYYITTQHPMTREHYISFVALLNDDTVTFKKLYPEWDVQVRLPRIPYGRLVWYCTQQGLKYQLIKL